MKAVERILSQRRLILFAAVFLALLGAISVLTMPREEDPRMGDYWGMVITRFPGADVKKVERLVADPVEEWLAEVEEIKHVDSIIRAGCGGYENRAVESSRQHRRSMGRGSTFFGQGPHGIPGRGVRADAR